MTSTSANPSGRPNLFLAKEVYQEIGKQEDAILGGGETPGEPGSRVLDISEILPKINRPEAVSLIELALSLKGKF